MQNFARFAKAAGQKAVPVVAGVAASSSVALADAPSRDEVVSPIRRCIQDSWEFAELDKETVLFKPAEIDEAISELCRRPQSAVIEEVETTDVSSDGSVDAILECSIYSNAEDRHVADCPLTVQELMTVASRMLKSPGLQREMIIAALSDPEVFSILESKVDLPQYLEATGFAAKGLLVAPEGEQCRDSDSPQQDSSAIKDGDVSNPLLQLSAKVAEGVEQLGNAVARLGRWMRTQITGDDAQATAEASSSSEGGRAPRTAPNKRVDSVLGAVMVVCVAVVAVVLMRRPSALKGLLKSLKRARAA